MTVWFHCPVLMFTYGLMSLKNLSLNFEIKNCFARGQTYTNNDSECVEQCLEQMLKVSPGWQAWSH